MFSFIGLFLMAFSVILFFYGIYGLLFKSSHRDGFMKEESKRVFNENAIYKEGYSSKGRVYTKGIGVFKDKFWNKKIKIIPQAKVCDIGLID